MFRSNASSFAKQLENCYQKKIEEAATRVFKTARFVHKSLIDKTPVWEGVTVRNYIMTIGTPYAGVLPEIGGVPTGRTNQMPLGTEPRRAENAAAALESGSVLTKVNAFSKIYITNNSDSVSGLEHGELPGDGYTPRSPNGMFGITLEEALSRLNSKAL